MLNAALLVFRESLEASLLIGILAAATRLVPRGKLWIAFGILAGCGGAFAVAALTGAISAMANGLGHELFNAAVLGCAVAMLAWHNIWMSHHGRALAQQAQTLGGAVSRGELAMGAVCLAVALTVLREGSETVLFFYGFRAGATHSTADLVQGASLGLLSGILLGALVYAGLVRLPVRSFFKVTAWLLLLVAAGMASQLAQLLIQADLLPPLIQPLWDTSALLPQDSTAGTVLRALLGYDPQPSALQVFFAVGVFFAVALATRAAGRPPTPQARRLPPRAHVPGAVLPSVSAATPDAAPGSVVTGGARA